MKLSPLAEIKRDELAHAVCQALANPIIRSMYPSMSRGHAYDLFRDLYMTGFEKGYAFANQEKDSRAEKLLRIRLEHDFDLFWHTTLGKLITEALAEYRQGSSDE